MDTVVYDAIEKLQAKANEIKLAVDELQSDVSLFGSMLDDIQIFTSETNVVVKDILLGTQIADWIEDLKASGTSSATYNDESRMNTLIANADAARTTSISQILYDWSVSKNKTGVYFGACLGTVSGVTWNNLTTPNAVTSHPSAFEAVSKDEIAFRVSMDNSVTKTAIRTNWSITEEPMGNAIAVSILKSYQKKIQLYNLSGSSDSASLNGFVLSVGPFAHNTVTVHCLDGTSVSRSVGAGDYNKTPQAINRFADSVSSTDKNITGARTEADVYYVDFS